MKRYKTLIINPGSTSTKVAVFKGREIVFGKNIKHPLEDLRGFDRVIDQYDYRYGEIKKLLVENKIDITSFDGVIGRGGLLKPIESGSYRVNEKMIEDLKVGVQGEHAANLGAILAYNIAKKAETEAFIVDPVVVDEMQDLARISGLKEIERRSIFHALNQKAVARRHAINMDKNYEDLNLIVAHLGGGISIGLHEKARVVDLSNALTGEGPFTPERSGALPAGELVELCYSGKYSYEEMKKKIVGRGGFMSYLDTNDCMLAGEKMRSGDPEAEIVVKAMAYQIAKEIGSLATVVNGNVDAILITGGIAHYAEFTSWIKDRVRYIANVFVYPGEDELTALALGGLRVLEGSEEAKEYI